MEKKKFSIELPKGGMSDLTKQVRNAPITEPPADATEWQRFTRYLDEFKNVSEHGEYPAVGKRHTPCFRQGTSRGLEKHSFWLIVK